LSNNDVLQILAQHQQKWEAMATKLLYSNSALKAIDIVQDMYLKVFDELTNNELEIENLIVNNKPHYGVIKTIIKRLIQVKSKDKNNNIRLKDLHKEIADKEKQEEHIDDKIDKVLQEMYWFDRKLFNLYRKEFHSIRKLSKATKISHVTVHKTIAKCKQELKNKIKL
jgi:DNA-directed RNA polymerase specialized sigma24 family protein